MKLVLALAFLLSAHPCFADEQAHPQLLVLEQNLQNKLDDKAKGRVTVADYQAWVVRFDALLEETAAKVPPSAINMAAHARIVAALGEPGRAHSALDQGLNQNPDSPVLIRTKGQLLFEQNDYAGAAKLGLLAWEKSGHADMNAWALYQSSKGRTAPSSTAPAAPPPAISPAGTPRPDTANSSRTQLPRGFKAFSGPPPSPISEPASLPSTIDEPVSVKTAAVVLSGPRKIDPAYRGSGAEAQVWTAAYSDGTRFEIVAPNTPNSALRFHTVEQAAEASRYLPLSSRAMVKQIVLSPGINPDDAYWSATYHHPGFHSYMTSGAAGIIRIYPNPAKDPLPSDNFMRGTLIHETGHTWANRNWGSDRTKGKWAKWRAAMAADKNYISEYAKSSIAEDFAETYQAFWSLKGTPRFLVHKSALPNRFSMLEKEVK